MQSALSIRPQGLDHTHTEVNGKAPVNLVAQNQGLIDKCLHHVISTKVMVVNKYVSNIVNI